MAFEILLKYARLFKHLSFAYSKHSENHLLMIDKKYTKELDAKNSSITIWPKTHDELNLP